MMGADVVVSGQAGNGHIVSALREDVAEASPVVLTGAGHEGQTHDLTGSTALTFTEIAEMAEINRSVPGLSVRLQNEADSEALASRAGSDTDLEIRGTISSDQGIWDGRNAAVSRLGGRLTGKPLCSIELHPQAPAFASASAQRAGA